MPDMWFDVSADVSAIPVNKLPLTDSADFFTPRTNVSAGSAGLELYYNFVDLSGVTTLTTVVAVTAGNYQWQNLNEGMYAIQVNASGATISNKTHGYGYFTGFLTSALPFRSETFGFRPASLNDALIENTDNIRADVRAVSASTSAASGLQIMYDGTGNTDSTAPASRAQVDGIGAASGGSLNFANEADNVDSAIKSISFDGVETSGTNASANFEDGTYHQIDDTANNIDIVYQFDIGGGRTAVEVTWKGRLVGTNDEMTIQAYNGTGWDTLKTVAGHSNSAPSSSADNATEVIPLLGTHTGTGSDLGKVFIRLECASQSNPTIYTDQLLVAGVNIGQSIGYAGGAIWIDTNNGVAGTESFVNGTADNPVDSIADATTLASNVGIQRFQIAAGSSVTLAQTYSSYQFVGTGWTLALGGQDISSSYIEGATVSGTATGTTPIFVSCIFDSAATLPACIVRDSFLGDTTITLGTGDYFFNGCIDRATGLTSPDFDFGAAVGDTNLNIHDYHGAVEIENIGDNGTDTAVISGNGRIVVNANSSGGTITAIGIFDIEDNASGVTVTQKSSLNRANLVGYAEGSVWLDTTITNTNTQDYVDGTADNPVSTIAAAKTIADSIGLRRICVASGSSFTLAAAFDNYEFHGSQYTIALGGQSLAGTMIVGATVSGTFVGTTAVLEDCIINAITGAGITMRRCFFNDVTITANGAGDWFLNECKSRVAGTASPNFDFGAAVGNTSLNLRAYSGGIEIENMGGSGTDTSSIEGWGNITLNANCSGGTMAIRGNITVTDNSGGAVTLSDDARIDVGQVSAAVDDALTNFGVSTLASAGVSAIMQLSMTNFGVSVLTSAQVNDEVNDVISTDTRAEPGQGAPGATISLGEKVDYIYKDWRNKKEVSTSAWSLYADDGTTVDQKAAITSTSALFTKDEIITGA